MNKKYDHIKLGSYIKLKKLNGIDPNELLSKVLTLCEYHWRWLISEYMTISTIVFIYNHVDRSTLTVIEYNPVNFFTI